MNEFIELRESITDLKKTSEFSQLLLSGILSEKDDLLSEEELFSKRLNNICNINSSREVSVEKLLELLSYLGENSYIDRYTVDSIIQNYNLFPREKFIDILKTQITNENNDGEKTYHLLDLLLEFDFDILSDDSIYRLLYKYSSDFDIVSLLFEYMGHFKREVPKEYLYKELEKNYPDTIKIQILDVMCDLYLIENLDLNIIKTKIINKENQVFIEDYIKFLKDKHIRIQKGLIVLQSMFYGDFEGSGKGNNGGLAILLKSLGNKVSFHSGVGLVITITISELMNKPFMAYYQENHLFVRLPAYLNRNIQNPFLKRELFMKRFIKRYLIKLNIQPEIFHIRYLDNASMAVGKLSKELNAKLVSTLAPDPHRNMVDEKGYFQDFEFDEIQNLVNKIKIGDELIPMSDKVLGIGGEKIKEELILYFPQFNQYNGEAKIKMIPEGIKIDRDVMEKREEDNTCEASELIGVDPSFFEKPIILNVGRLDKIKGQVALFKAWTASNINKTHNLLIIGGDLENPNEEEKRIIDFFNREIKKYPELEGKFFHKAAMKNEKVKLLEKSIMKKSFSYPHIYLASSLKEEFGLAILEAMSQGFLIFAPIKGGVKSYIEHGVNGFLIDTSTPKTIVRDVEEILYNLGIKNEEFRRIQDSGKATIEKNFSIDEISKTFAHTYLSLLGGRENEL